MSNATSVTVGADLAVHPAAPTINAADVADVPVRIATSHSITAHDLRPQRSGLFSTARDHQGLPPERLTEDSRVVFRGIEMTLKAAERAGIVERTQDGEGWREVSVKERTDRDNRAEQERRAEIASEMAPDTDLDYVLPGVTKEIGALSAACASSGVDMDQHVAMLVGNPDAWFSTQAPRVAHALGVPVEELSGKVEKISQAVRVQFANEAEAFGADGYAFLDWVETQSGYRSAVLRAYHGDYRPMRQLAKQFAGTSGALSPNMDHPQVRTTPNGHQVIDVMINGKRVEVSVRNARQLGLI